MADLDCDVLIAGGSVAGIATAAALREFGWSVLIVEPGQRVERRLAGELIHPMGIAGLVELGLFDPAAFAGAAPIEGFAVFPDAGESRSRVTLSYGSGRGTSGRPAGRAMAIDYPVLRRNLEAAARRLDHVTFVEARVLAIDMSDRATPKVTIDEGGTTRVVCCRMIVGADGASSPVRTLAGIGHKRRDISTIAGYVIDRAALPAPGYGHVIIGGPALVLAYEIGGGRARVMFDRPVERNGLSPSLHRDHLLAAIPAPFRQQVTAGIGSQKPLSFKSAEVIVEATSRGAAVLVGDAGGSCHPLTATGMTIGICDSLRLRDALRRHGGNMPKAFRCYDHTRRKAQRSRRLVASALHDACSRNEPEMRVLRDGLVRYWRKDAPARTATMAILAMTDDRLSSAFWHLVKVIRHGLVEHWARQPPKRRLYRVGLSLRMMASLGGLAFRQLGASLKVR